MRRLSSRLTTTLFIVSFLSNSISYFFPYADFFAPVYTHANWPASLCSDEMILFRAADGEVSPKLSISKLSGGSPPKVGLLIARALANPMRHPSFPPQTSSSTRKLFSASSFFSDKSCCPSPAMGTFAPRHRPPFNFHPFPMDPLFFGRFHRSTEHSWKKAESCHLVGNKNSLISEGFSPVSFLFGDGLLRCLPFELCFFPLV